MFRLENVQEFYSLPEILRDIGRLKSRIFIPIIEECIEDTDFSRGACDEIKSSKGPPWSTTDRPCQKKSAKDETKPTIDEV